MEAINGNESLYRALFEQTNDGVFIISLDLKYLAVNQQAADMLGYEIEEIVSMPVDDIVALEQTTDNQRVSSPTEEANEPVYERIFRRKDGTTFPVEISTSIVYDNYGIPIHIQSYVRDITERKRSEITLFRREKILEAVGFAAEQFMRSSIWEGDIIEVLKKLGQAADVNWISIKSKNIDCQNGQELKQIADWISSDSFNDVVKTDLGNILKQQGLSLCEEDFHQSEGMYVELKELPRAGMNGNTDHKIQAIAIAPIFVKYDLWGFIIFADFTNQREWSKAERDAIIAASNIIGAAIQRDQFESELHQSVARNRTIVEALPDLVLRIDRTGKLLEFIANEKHPLHMPRDSVVGKRIQDIWPQTISDLIMAYVSKTLESGSSHLFEDKFLDDIRTYETRFDGISENEVLAIIRDVSDRARLEQMKSDFINRASHELRTPLTTAILMTDLIKEGGAKEELEEFWKILTSELNRQKILIDRFLIAGRLESNMLALEPAPMDLMPVLEESIAAVSPLARKKEIEIVKEIPLTIPEIVGDKSGLQQVFINLINNAIKFSPEGSRVTIEVVKKSDMLGIKIQDQGIGIPVDDLPHMFKRFYRARNVTLAEIPGSGVGLYLVKSIVEKLGGEIYVTSSVGQGTMFEVALKVS